MSRAFKDGLADEVADLGGTGFATVANTEQLSGADLEQARLAVLNGSTAAVTGAGRKTFGTNAAMGQNVAACSGADLERFTGTQ